MNTIDFLRTKKFYEMDIHELAVNITIASKTLRERVIREGRELRIELIREIAEAIKELTSAQHLLATIEEYSRKLPT